MSNFENKTRRGVKLLCFLHGYTELESVEMIDGIDKPALRGVILSWFIWAVYMIEVKPKDDASSEYGVLLPHSLWSHLSGGGSDIPSPYSQVRWVFTMLKIRPGRLLCCEGIHNTILWYQTHWEAYSLYRRQRQEIGQTWLCRKSSWSTFSRYSGIWKRIELSVLRSYTAAECQTESQGSSTLPYFMIGRVNRYVYHCTC